MERKREERDIYLYAIVCIYVHTCLSERYNAKAEEATRSNPKLSNVPQRDKKERHDSLMYPPNISSLLMPRSGKVAFVQTLYSVRLCHGGGQKVGKMPRRSNNSLSSSSSARGRGLSLSPVSASAETQQICSDTMLRWVGNSNERQSQMQSEGARLHFDRSK